MPIPLLPSVSGSELYAWVDPDGTEHALNTAAGYDVLVGMSGRWYPDMDIVEDIIPQQPGARWRETVVRPRTVDIPILVRGSTYLQRDQRVRELARWVDGRRGESRFRVTALNDAILDLIGRGTLTMNEGPEERQHIAQTVIVTMRAQDPYWRDKDAISPDPYVSGGTVETWFGRPWFPFRLASSTVIANPTIDNDGDVEAWPSWLITGPGTNPVLRNLTSGKRIALDSYTLVPGQQILIDTAPGVKSVTDALGTNLFGSLSGDSELWPLVRGSNAIQIELGSATSVSSVVVSYRRRFLTPLTPD